LQSTTFEKTRLTFLIATNCPVGICFA